MQTLFTRAQSIEIIIIMVYKVLALFMSVMQDDSFFLSCSIIMFINYHMLEYLYLYY